MSTPERISASIARIVSSIGVTLGTGFVIAPGYVVTSWDAINGADTVHLVFGEDNWKVSANLVPELSSSGNDIAILRLAERHHPALQCAFEYSIGDRVWSYGFAPHQDNVAGYSVSGILSENANAGERHLLAMNGANVDVGLTGSPLLQQSTGLVIGMMSARGHQAAMTVAIPMNMLAEHWPDATESVRAVPDRVAAEIASLLELLGYKARTHEAIEGVPSPDIYAEMRIGFTVVRTVVACFEAVGPVGTEPYLTAFANEICLPLFASKRIENAFAVSANNHPFTKEAVDFARSMGIQPLTLRELEDNLIDFSPYVEAYIDDYEHYESFAQAHRYPVIDQLQFHDLFRDYVSLRCRDVLDADRNPEKTDEVISSWLGDPTGRQLAILGDYGAGKSSVGLHLAYSMIKAYQQHRSDARVPLFFALRDYDPHTSLRAFILEKLSQYRILVNDYRAFEKMMLAGRLLLIFDGFDELVEATDKQTALSRFREISRLAKGKSKIVLTCRSQYFKTEEQSVDLLMPELMTPFMRELSRTEHYALVELLGLNEGQILELIAKHTGTDPTPYWDAIKAIYDLTDLASRPILLMMILQTLPQLQELRGQVNSTSLYSAYTTFWLEREKWRSVLSTEDKFHFAEELAWQMFIQGRLAVRYDDLLVRIATYFQGRYTQGEIAQTLDSDIRTSSFLTRDRAGYFTFIHKSFMEFLVARKLAQEMEEGILDDLGQKLVPIAILTFLKDLLSPKGIERVKAVAIHSQYSEVIKGVCMDILLFLGATVTEVPWMFSVSFSRDGRHLATGHADCTIRIWDVDNLAKPPRVLESHTSWVRSAQYSPTGVYLASCGWDKHVKLWRTTDWSLVYDVEMGEKVVSVCFSPDGSLLAIGGFDRMIHLWDTATGKLVREWGGHYGVVWDLAFSPDGMHLASACTDKVVRVWSAATGELRSTLAGHEDAVSTVCFTTDGHQLLSGDWIGELIAWEWTSGQEVYRQQAHTNKVGEISVNADGKHYVTSGDDLKVRVWVAENGDLVHVFSEPTYFLPAVQYNADGQLIGCGGFDRTLRIWDAQSWVLLSSTYVEGYSGRTATPVIRRKPRFLPFRGGAKD